jgi:magnesium chelatase family protein
MAYAPYGAGGVIIRVEADIRRGIPGIDITGLAEGAVREARERVRAAFRNSGFDFPPDRILINLAPAGLRKDGASLDLPIALSVMAAAGIAPAPGDLLVMGELELSGRIRPVRGVLAAVAAGLENGISEFIVPEENAREAAILCPEPAGEGPAGACFTAAASLREAVHALFVRDTTGALPRSEVQDGGRFAAGSLLHASAAAAPDAAAGDFADVRGQRRYKRALEIAAAGGHNLLVFGPPGAGKTMLARRVPSIMAPLSPEEAVEVTRLYSLAGAFGGGPAAFAGGLITRPPFRAPHHSSSAEGILGGGKTVRPGEISLAHYGVLFLDEAPEFKSNVLQALREPLEDRVISIVRAEGPVRLPAEFQLILAANSCPCGRLGMREPGDAGGTGGAADTEGIPARDGTAAGRGCFCSPEEIQRYWRRFGAALLDRVELRVAVLPPAAGDMSLPAGEGSAEIARRVEKAVDIQRRRLRGTNIRRNALIPAGLIDSCCPLSARAEAAFRRAITRLALSGRACHGILRLARTIADLEGSEPVDAVHVLEAIQHRRLGEDPYDIFTAEAERSGLAGWVYFRKPPAIPVVYPKIRFNTPVFISIISIHF